MAHPIGETAGKVWKFLEEKGMKADPNLILQAIGSLAREDKFFDRAGFPVSKKEREFLVLPGAQADASKNL